MSAKRRIFVVWALLSVGAAQPCFADPYQLGHGLALGSTGFTLGGYGALSYEDVEDGEPASVALDSLSAMLWWDGGGSLHFLSETELDRGVTWQDDELTTRDADVVSERLYVDWTPTEIVKLRVGKFLTPIGRWNVIHAAPLVWTTSRPLITEATFPTNATGLMAYGTLPLLPDGVEYSLYGAIGHELFENDELDTFSEAIGLRLAANLLPHTQVGLSAATYEQESDEEVRKNLIGADFAWTWHRFEVSGEFAHRSLQDRGTTKDEHGLYLQLVAPLSQRWYAVTRYERFDPEGTDEDLDLFIGGIDFKPLPSLVLKSEYSHATRNGQGVPDGFRASIAVLF